MRALIVIGLLWTGLLVACSQNPEDPLVGRVDAAISSGYEYLLGRQERDGAWRSKLYPGYTDGESLSPLVIKALLYGPAGPEGQAAAARGLEFLASRLPPRPSKMTFPVYSLSMAAIDLSRDSAHQEVRDAIITYLRGHQLTEQLGWKPEDLSYGGWGESKEPYRRPPGDRIDPSRSANLSVTLFALGALRLAGAPPDDPAIQKALVFVQRCQNFPGDGGFFFSPTNLRQNKAGDKRSYGSMTADGLRALLRCGLSGDDPRVRAARGWVLEHYDPLKNSGEFPPGQEEMREALYFYYCWTTAHALVESGPPAEGDWARPMCEELLRRQHPKGYWRNEQGRMTEDEPLVATPMALAALVMARSALSSSP